MTLIEVIATVLGPAIAKAILKKWLKDSALANDLTSSLVDLIKLKTSDALTQARTARQFEAIGERVAESLIAVFEAEGARIPENGRVAVALMVAHTLEKAGIDPALLAKKNLEPRLLADFLLMANPNATRDFSSAEAALYNRSIQEASQYIVDIASQLPNFSERTFGELLKRQNHLQNIADQILNEVHRIREEAKQDDVEAALFEVEYRRAVVRNLDELQLFGVDASTASRRHKLSVAYVTLSVSERLRTETVDDEDTLPIEDADIPKNGKRKRQELNDAANEGVPVDKTLKNTRRLLILGEAGSGKTTLLQWVAVRAAKGDFEGDLCQWNDLTPFFIRLRQCVETGLPSPEEFPRFVAPAIAGTMPVGWVHDKLKKGHAVVLIDGLDELGEAARQNVRTWLKDLTETYADVRFIVSSRPYAVEQGWLKKEKFEEAELLPMEWLDISAFIDHWHSAVREELQIEDERLELDLLKENLKQVIRKSIQFRKLATNPLLCAMLCALHRDRQRKLPSDRIELYDACFRMLVDRRDVERGVDLSDYPVIPYRQKRALLQDFAYWLLKNGYSMVQFPAAAQRFKQKLDVLEGVSKEITGESVRRLFIERSGILREPVTHQVDFTHRTFQEFLGAQTALDDGDIGLLVKNAHLEEWREVVVLAAGLARANEREEIIRQLIERGDAESGLRHQLHLLAVACLETSIELSPTLKKEVSKRLQKLIPPKSITEAKSLASSGELALPFLAQRYRRANITAACIRTLALIGGDEALNTLEEYYPDGRTAVNSEFTKGWEYFDRKDYAKQIFGKSNRLTLRRPGSLEGLESVTSLTELFVFDANRLKDISTISALPNLKTLHFAYLVHVPDLSPLLDLSQLDSLYIWGSPAQNLSGLPKNGKLTSLTLGHFWALEELTSMEEMQSLTSLRLFYLTNILDLSPLAKLKSLSSLRLSRLDRLETLGDAWPLTQLEELHVMRCNRLADLGTLRSLDQLKTIEVRVCPRLDDLKGLSRAVRMERLVATHCETLTDISPISSLENLKHLDLSYTNVADLRPLLTLQNLRRLNIQGTPASQGNLPEALVTRSKRLKVIK